MSDYIKTNKVIAIINHSQLLKKYQFFKITHDAKNEKEYQKFYGAIRKNIKPLAHATSKKYILIACDIDFDISPFRHEFEMSKLRIVEIQREPDYLILNLLNSLLTQSSHYFEVDGDPYGLYYVLEKLSSKLVTLKIDINSQMLLSVKAVSFVKTVNKKEKEKYFVSGDKLVRSTIYEDDKVYFKKGNYSSKKASCNFIGVFSVENYKKSKIYILSKYLKLLKYHFGDIVDINFKELKLELSLAVKEAEKTKRKNLLKDKIVQQVRSASGLHIVNLTNLNLQKEIGKLHTLIMEYFCNDIDISFSDQMDSKKNNLTISYDEDYYKKNNKIDFYKETKKLDLISQNITLDVLKNIDENLVHVILKEIVIKQEVSSKKVILPQKHLEEPYDFVYPVKQKDSDEYNFYRTKFDNQNIDFLEPESSQLRICNEIAFGIKRGEELESIIFNGVNINYIVRTQAYLLPNYQDIESLVDEFEKPANVKADEVLEICSEYMNEEEIKKLEADIDANINVFTNTIDLKSLKIKNKKVKNRLKQHFGVKFTFDLRSAENKHIVEPLTGIRYSEDERIYTVGVSGTVNVNISKASIVREVRAYKGNGLLLPIVSMLDEYFVKNKDFTVLPYPMKYIRERYQI